ncbi:MAG TPA: alpha/beta hydrolase [Baekduia sp.]|nr:alpha/beta hydrolase [Baekduia sp.]
MRRAALGLAAGVAAAGWEAARRADRRALERDPLRERLAVLPRGRVQPVAAPDGTQLHVEVHGPDGGPTIVLTHGWTCTTDFWALQVQDLVAAGLRVVTWDLRGHGLSGRPASGDYAMERFAEDLAAVLDATLADRQRAVVAGHSLGAMTIVALAAEHPEVVRERLAAAALVNTGVGDLVSESLVVRAPATVTNVVGRLMLEARAPIPGVSTPISHRLVRHIALCPDAPPAAVAFSERLVGDCHPHVRAGVGATLTRLELHEGLEHLAVPTTVIAGGDDRLTPPVHAERMAAELPQLVELCVLPKTGHMAPLERDADVSSRLRALVHDHLQMAATAA